MVNLLLNWTIDPLVYGDYPPEMRRYHGSELPSFSTEETEWIKGSIDFIGINHYSAIYVKDCIYSSCNQAGNRTIQGFVETTGERDGVPTGEPTGMPAFFVVPRGMEEIVNYLKNRYRNKPMFVTENAPFGNCSVGNSDVEPLIAVHNMLLAHAKAAKLYRVVSA
ncbi:unnamed protein product [Ilex paraguariensis]|uniref:Beta-glucosidase n=1 Tax=Ilex paraguariensis TaxID=185542 RepID=A0ABC8UD56_9AQUA